MYSVSKQISKRSWFSEDVPYTPLRLSLAVLQMDPEKPRVCVIANNLLLFQGLTHINQNSTSFLFTQRHSLIVSFQYSSKHGRNEKKLWSCFGIAQLNQRQNLGLSVENFWKITWLFTSLTCVNMDIKQNDIWLFISIFISFFIFITVLFFFYGS